MKNKKGFTLIELLAVIVVLAIVMVLATTTVLPYMANARKDAFDIDVKNVKDAASKAMSLIAVGSVDANYSKNTGGDYCFTMADLKTLGILEKDDTKFVGYVIVDVSSNAYTYKASVQNGSYYIDDNATTAVPITEGTPTSAFTNTCPSGYTAVTKSN